MSKRENIVLIPCFLLACSTAFDLAGMGAVQTFAMAYLGLVISLAILEESRPLFRFVLFSGISSSLCLGYGLSPSSDIAWCCRRHGDRSDRSSHGEGCLARQ